MSARKLSDADKKAILEEYRQPGETTLTIANRYGVSNSTISRMLKSSLSPEEYEVLIQQKRSARGQTSVTETPADPATAPEPSESERTVQSASTDSSRRIRKRSSADSFSNREDSVQLDLELAEERKEQEENNAKEEKAFIPNSDVPQSIDLQDPEPDDLEDEELEDEDDFDEDDDLDDFDDDDDDDADDSSDLDVPIPKRGTRILGQLRILPFEEALLPKTCYIVVDRTAELIARPLKEFGDLGQIPPEEIQEKTLPVFDNHRVARRFANRSQRVTKVPDGKMLQRVKGYIQAKGITRILVDGQVYSL